MTVQEQIQTEREAIIGAQKALVEKIIALSGKQDICQARLTELDFMEKYPAAYTPSSTDWSNLDSI